MVGDHLHNAKDGSREQQTPYPPEPHQKSNTIHTDIVFIFVIWLGIQVTTNMTIVHVATRIFTQCCEQYPECGEEYWRWLLGC